jgi:hypothetical protein
MIFLFCSHAGAQTFDTFAWLTKNEHPLLYDKISATFFEELRPDVPNPFGRTTPNFYKYLAKIGAFRDSFIVLIGYREQEDDTQVYDFYRAFSYDEVSGTKTEVQPAGIYYRLTLVTLASFEPSAIPDIIFKYYNCLECEKVELLSAFRFDNTWKTRVWPDNDPHLLISSDTQYGDDHWSYDCLHKIADFTSDKFADIAIRCKITGQTSHKVTDELLLYTIQNGVAIKKNIRDAKYKQEITKSLCEGQHSPLCARTY